jgi:pectinesterase
MPVRKAALLSLALLGACKSQSPSAEPSATERELLQHLARAGNIDSGLVEDGWDPRAGIRDLPRSPELVVASDGRYTSVQGAIDAAVALGGSARRYIAVSPGTYREIVCVPAGAPPITLYGIASDPARVVIVYDNYSGKPRAADTAVNPCLKSEGTTIGTRASATFAAAARGFQARNLSFVNDTDESALTTKSIQAVALAALGDQQIFEDVRVLGNQDSLLLYSADASSVVRQYFKHCYVEGDTDFVFGRATALLEGCTFHSLGARTQSGVILAPSTDARVEHGLLVIDGTFTADDSVPPGSTQLGRAWDEGQVDVATYAQNVKRGVFPNGHALVQRSWLGPHIARSAPWRAAATTARPYDARAGELPANRLYERDNRGP